MPTTHKTRHRKTPQELEFGLTFGVQFISITNYFYK